ncbi:MAG: CRISPR-associated endonuclease Cas2 [Clostridiales bacterium]|jgi:CRISPR-associated protein Cas2|nr:CRISPR-associated endonuclease Cas2 [Clostridiales bacterium]
MYILITYDINTTSLNGQKRLRKVAKICINYGQRVQNSVFECKVNESQYRELQHKLVKVIDQKVDSLRFYRLGDNYDKKVKHIGAKETYKVEEPMIL